MWVSGQNQLTVNQPLKELRRFESCHWYMITAKDISKQCFIKFKLAGSERYTWENVGARIVGIEHKHGRVIVRMPGGERVAVKIEDVRAIEPRPG